MTMLSPSFVLQTNNLIAIINLMTRLINTNNLLNRAEDLEPKILRNTREI
jgi:hypothetical protein